MNGVADSPLSGVRSVAAQQEKYIPLDELDIALLQLLVSDARASQRSLAASLGVSTPTVSERMSRLEKSGAIMGYSAQINWSAVGFTETVYLSINSAAGYDVAAIMADLWDIPEVQELNLVTGELDLLVRLRVRNNEHLRKLLMDRVWQISGMQGTATLMSVAEMPTKNFSAGLLKQMQNGPNAES